MAGSTGDQPILKALLQRLLLQGPHTCPWWLGYSFDNPPHRILHGLISPGDTVVDVGCGLGYFTLALAERVGPGGRVIALDIQPTMLQRAAARARRHSVEKRIDFRHCAAEQFNLEGPIDFALAFWMVHEVSQPVQLLETLFAALRPGGCLLIAEPRVHVTGSNFDKTLAQARAAGFHIDAGPKVRFSRSRLCTRPLPDMPGSATQGVDP